MLVKRGSCGGVSVDGSNGCVGVFWSEWWEDEMERGGNYDDVVCMAVAGLGMPDMMLGSRPADGEVWRPWGSRPTMLSSSREMHDQCEPMDLSEMAEDEMQLVY